MPAEIRKSAALTFDGRHIRRIVYHRAVETSNCRANTKPKRRKAVPASLQEAVMMLQLS